ncbi:MAG: hypothetical protein EHM41_08690, partial [Chloroflexi bacterium]
KPVEIVIVDVFPAMTIAQGIEVTVYYTVKPLVNGVPVNDPTTAGLPEVSGEVVVTDGQEQCAGELPILNCTFTPKTSGEHNITATYLGDDVYERRTTTYSKVLKVIGEDLKVMPPGITVNGTLTTTVGITSTIAFTLTPSSGTTPYPPSGLFYMLVGDQQICSNVQVLPVTGKNIAVGKCTTILDTIGERQVAVFYRQDKIYNALDLTGKFNVIPASSEIVILSPLTGSFHINEDFEIEFQARNAGNINSTPSSGTVTILAPENVANTPCGTVGTNGLGSCNFSFSYSGTNTGSGLRSLKLEYSGDGQNFYASQSITYIYTILNDPPVAVNDSYTTNEDTSLVVSPPGILANDFDPEGETITVTAYTAPFFGSLSGLTPQGGFIFNPGGDFAYLAVGEQSIAAFSYGITDGERDSGTAGVSISVTGVNDAPNLPAITSPTDNSERNPLNLTLQWTGTDPDTSDVLSYDVYFGTGANPPIVTTTGANSYSLTSLLPNTEYTWFIVSKDVYTETEGPHWSFWTAPLPGNFDKLSPLNEEPDLLFPVTLTWETSIDAGGITADSYDICIDQVDNGTCDAAWQPMGAITSTVINRPEYSYANTYYWQVRANNTAGETYADGGSWWWFNTLGYPEEFSLLYPAPAADSIHEPVTLDWEDSGKADDYRVCYYGGSLAHICVNTGITSTYTIPESLDPATVYYWQVWAINEAGETLPITGPAYQYFITVPAPWNFWITGPGSDLQPIPVPLSWTESRYATDYEVCVSEISGICSGWMPLGNVTSTEVYTYFSSISPTEVLTITPDTTYFWQVRASNTFGTVIADNGFWANFTTMPLPGDFTKLSPGDGSINHRIPLRLQWDTLLIPISMIPNTFEYCVNTTASCTQWLPAGTSGWIDVTDLTGDTQYYWQIRALNGAGSNEANDGIWWSFRTHPKPDPFTKTIPISGTVDLLSSLTLSWGGSTGADYYQYCYDTTSDDACTNWSNAGLSQSIGITGLISDTTYYWQVRAHNEFGDTYADNGTWFNFSTLPPPGQFSKTGPDPAGIQPIPTTLTWTDSTKASSYDICVNTAETCASWTTIGSITSTQVTTYYTGNPATLQPISPDTTYYWQVRATNHFGTMYADGDDTSGTWNTFTTMPLPDDFSKIQPEADGLNQILPLTLEWGTANGADSYQYCYEPSWYTTKCDSDSNWVDAGTSNSAVLTTGLNAGTLYNWQVRAVNGAGYKEAVDGWRSFTTMLAPQTFTKEEPSSSATNQVIPLTLRWSSSTWADSYEYCLYTTAEGSTKCDTDTNWVNVGTNLSDILTTELTAGTTYYWQVRAVNTLDTMLADGGWYSFSTLSTPASFSKDAPADDLKDLEIPLTLSWIASGSVTSYQYCYDEIDNNQCDIGGGWKDVGITTTTVVTDVLANTNYYWQVRAVNPFTTTEANSGTWWNFKTKKQPDAFVKLSPGDVTDNWNKPLTLEWQASGGATYYEYCIDTNVDAKCPSKNDWIRVDSSAPLTVTVTITDIIVNTQYEWQVRAVNSFAKVEANGNDWWVFDTANVPSSFLKESPTNNTDPSINSTAITLSWNASTYALNYEYCYYASGDPLNCSQTTDTEVLITGLIPDTSYNWQVWAINSFSTTEADGGYWMFKTVPVPGEFDQRTPIEGAVDQKLPLTLEWQTSMWASSYEISINTVDIISTWQAPTGITSTVLTSLEPGTTYYWWVRSVNSFGNTFADGDGWAFTTQALPGAFNKASPGNNSTGIEKTARLSWIASDANAEKYQYCIDNNVNSTCDGTGSWIDINLPALSVIINDLLPGEEYEWQVRAVNSLGNTYANDGEANGGWWTFTTMDLPASFSKSAPGNGDVDVELPLTLDWSPSTDAASYEYCFDDEITHTYCADTANWVSISSGTEAVLDTPTLVYSTTYYWQVRGVNTFGSTPANTDEWWSFTTLREPAPFTKNAPTDGAVNQSIPLTVSWTHPAGSSPVDYYSYCLSSTDGVCVAGWLTTTATTASLTELVYNTTYYWQVQAVNDAGTIYADGESNWYSFKTVEPPGSFSKSLPANASSTLQPLTVGISWGTSSYAENYAYCYDQTAGTTCEGTWVTTTLTSASISGLSYSQTYYWQVRAANIVGTTFANGGDWWSFTTVPPPPTSFDKLTPINGASVAKSSDVVITWSESTNATDYKYCYYNATTGSTRCNNASNWVSTGGALTATIPDDNVYNNNTYNWQVRAYNSVGDMIEANDGWWSFVIDG